MMNRSASSRIVGAFVFPEFWENSSDVPSNLAALRDVGVTAIMTESDRYDFSTLEATHNSGLRFYAGVACFSDHAANFRFIEDSKQGTLRVYLKYGTGGEKIISGLVRVSKPGRRVYVAKDKVPHILGGILVFDSDWKPPLGDPLTAALAKNPDGRLDLSCAALHGTFACAAGTAVTIDASGKAATAFLLELIARLQEMATVPMMDTRAYARWLTP